MVVDTKGIVLDFENTLLQAPVSWRWTDILCFKGITFVVLEAETILWVYVFVDKKTLQNLITIW